jgi:hypothetical protein
VRLWYKAGNEGRRLLWYQPPTLVERDRVQVFERSGDVTGCCSIDCHILFVRKREGRMIAGTKFIVTHGINVDEKIQPRF